MIVFLVIDSNCPSMEYTAVLSIWQNEKKAQQQADKLNEYFRKALQKDYFKRYQVSRWEVGK